jgi:hypothetical protein
MPLQAWGECDSISAFSLAVGPSAIFGLTAVPGQLGIIVRQFTTGTSCFVGGASLTWDGAGQLSANTVSVQKIPATGTVYFAAQGNTAVVTGWRLISNEGNAG